MFSYAASFNSDLSKWDVSSANGMDAMFSYAVSFKQKMCGSAWVHSKASKIGIFAGTSGSISPAMYTSAPTLAITQVTRHYVTRRRPLSERELLVHTSITTPITTSVNTSAFISTILTTMTCPKCGTFEKSGQDSCCAPGGAWYKNCGGDGNNNVDHTWFEGAEVCKRKSEAYGM